MTDQAIVEVEWQPLASEDSFDSLKSLGSVTIKRSDGSSEDRGKLTRADTARLAAQIFGSAPTRVSLGGRVVKWIQAPWDKKGRFLG